MSKLIVIMGIITSLGISLGCPPAVRPQEIEALKSQLEAAVAASERAQAQLDFMTKEFAETRKELVALKPMVVPTVEVKPVTIDPRKTALIIVDMQNDFVLLGGALGPKTAAAAKANAGYISRIRALLDKCRAAGMPIIYTQDYHYENDPEFAIWPVHCLSGTWGVEIVSELAPKPGDYIVRKGGKTVAYDVFFASYKPYEMENTLKKLGVDTVIVTGTVSHICVYATVVGTAQRGYRTIVPKDCIISLPFWPFGERMALFQFVHLYNVAVTESGKITFK
jgi:nicotinamidase-related amidase